VKNLRHFALVALLILMLAELSSRAPFRLFRRRSYSQLARIPASKVIAVHFKHRDAVATILKSLLMCTINGSFIRHLLAVRTTRHQRNPPPACTVVSTRSIMAQVCALEVAPSCLRLESTALQGRYRWEDLQEARTKTPERLRRSATS